MNKLVQPVLALADWAEQANYAGYDPYDILNSPLSGVLSLGTRFGRIALTQFGRRCPVNFRPLMMVKRGVNPKALALFLEGYAALYRFDPQQKYLDRIHKITGMLADCRSKNIAGCGWGYYFPWQNRFQCLKPYTPTIVNSAFAGHALLDAYESAGDGLALSLAQMIPDFMLKELKRKYEQDTFCFSYTPEDTNFVHNANMLGASLLVRLAVDYHRSELLEPALAALKYSMNYQHDDGSWFYAETPQQSWIDSFHTGFNLEALRHFLRRNTALEYSSHYQRGVRFYAENFFRQDGTPKYYHNRLYLVDIHSPAEALSFFAGEGDEYQELCNRVLDWSFQNMYDRRNGLFYFRKARFFTIRIPYMRWSQAWAFRALCRCLTNGETIHDTK